MPEILDYGGYLLDFELNEEFLHGKRVLDLGAGARLFAYDAIDHSLCQTVSLDENSAGWQSLNLWAKKQLAKGKNPTVETISPWVKTASKPRLRYYRSRQNLSTSSFPALSYPKCSQLRRIPPMPSQKLFASWQSMAVPFSIPL